MHPEDQERHLAPRQEEVERISKTSETNDSLDITPLQDGVVNTASRGKMTVVRPEHGRADKSADTLQPRKKNDYSG